MRVNPSNREERKASSKWTSSPKKILKFQSISSYFWICGPYSVISSPLTRSSGSANAPPHIIASCKCFLEAGLTHKIPALMLLLNKPAYYRYSATTPGSESSLWVLLQVVQRLQHLFARYGLLFYMTCPLFLSLVSTLL